MLQSVAVPPGTGKTYLATALGHAAVRRRFTVHFERCDRLLKRLRASRLDNSHDTEMRKLLRVDLLIVDDFALQALDAVDTADVYELIVERHRAAARPLRRRIGSRSSGSARWPTPSSPNPPSTGCSPPPTNSSSTASPTGNARNHQSPIPTTTALTNHRPLGDHHDADADTPEVVPSHWRWGGPITLAGDSPCRLSDRRSVCSFAAPKPSP